jgi:hypothetical protein
MARTAKGMANLIPNRERTAERRREIAKMGGKASGVARAKHKALRDTLLELLSLPMKKGEVAETATSIEGMKSPDVNMSVRARIMLSMVTKAAKGDVKAASFIRDTIGEAPVQELKVEQSAVTQMSDEQLRRIASGEA